MSPSMGRAQGLGVEMCTVAELKDALPVPRDPRPHRRALRPLDGDIDPAQLTQALAKGARDLGAQHRAVLPGDRGAARERRVGRRDRKGRDPLREGGERRRLLRARVGEWFRRYGGAPGADGGDVAPVPADRADPRARGLDRGDGAQAAAAARRRQLLLPAPGEGRLQPRPLRAQLPRALGRRPTTRCPRTSRFQLYPDDLDRLEWYIEDAMARVPLLGAAGVEPRHQRSDPLRARRQLR